MMADIVRRRSRGGVLPLGRHASSSGSSLIHCVSVSMAPPHPGGAKCYPGAEVQGRTGPSGSFAARLGILMLRLLGFDGAVAVCRLQSRRADGSARHWIVAAAVGV